MKLFKLKPKQWNSEWKDNWEFIVRSSNEESARKLVKEATANWNWGASNDQNWDNSAWLDTELTVCDVWSDDRFAATGKEEILWPEENQWKEWDLWTKWS